MLDEFSHISNRFFGLDFPIELEYLITLSILSAYQTNYVPKINSAVKAKIYGKRYSKLELI